MGKYELWCEVTVSALTVVEADSLKEAIEIAEGREAVLGGINSGFDDSEYWVIEEADGIPQNIHE